MRDLLWLSPFEALAVVISTAGMYLSIVVIVRILGQRVLSSMSSIDFAAVIAFGSVIGRSALGETPRLGGGLVAIATLVVMQALAGQLRLATWGDRALSRYPVLLMAGGQVLEKNLHRCHVLPHELHSRLRQAGIRRPSEVAAVIFEPTGAISVLHQGTLIDPMLLSGVVGGALVPAHLIGQPDSDASDDAGPGV